MYSERQAQGGETTSQERRDPKQDDARYGLVELDGTGAVVGIDTLAVTYDHEAAARRPGTAGVNRPGTAGGHLV